MPIDVIVTGRFNPRRTFDPEHIKELAGSIRREGQWNPVILRQRSDEKYDIIAGECRLRAVKKLGLATIKARVLNVNNDEANLLALKTNLMRRDLNPVEEAHAVKKLIDMGWSLEKITKELDKSRTWLAFRLKLAENATEGLQNAVITKIIPLTCAVKICELSEGLQGPTVDKVVRDRLNFKEVNILVDLLKVARTPEELESIFTAPKERIMKWAISGNSFSERVETSDNGVSIIECSCGTKFIVDWTGHNVISKQNHRNGNFFVKALRFLRKKG